MSKQPTDWVDVSDWQDVGAAPAAAAPNQKTADYVYTNNGYRLNPINPSAKATGSVTVLGKDGKPYTIDKFSPAVPAMASGLIEGNIRNRPENQKKTTLQSVLSSANNFGNNLAQGLNPLPFGESVVRDILGTAKNVVSAQGEQFEKAKESFGKGNYSEAIGHGLAYALPIAGPAAARTGEQIGGGDISGGLGQATALTLPFALSELKAKNIPITPKLLTKNPAEAAAVRYGMREGLPVDAATATGNPAVRGTQWLADKSIGGSFLNSSAKATGAAKFSSVLDDLANKGGSAIHPAQAGESVRSALESKIATHHGQANVAYTQLRSIEADPKNLVRVQTGTKPVLRSDGSVNPLFPPTPVFEDIALPVDVRATKAALSPIYEQMKRQMPITQQQASPGFKALENIISGPDFASASQMDADLGAIKNVARGADSPYLRSVSQGVAAKAVGELGDAVDVAVKNGGQGAVDALRRGREATKAKYETAGVLDQLRAEPVQAFNQMVYSKDAGVQQLKEIAKHAPGEMPKVGSAFLNDMLDTATSQGAFDKAQGLWSKWDKLGPQTKAILFKDARYISDLDNFFLLAKKMAENPNPSGTALVGQTGLMVAAGPSAAPYALGLAGLSKILHSPKAVSIMVDGLKVSGKVPAAAITTANLTSILESNSKSQK